MAVESYMEKNRNGKIIIKKVYKVKGLFDSYIISFLSNRIVYNVYN